MAVAAVLVTAAIINGLSKIIESIFRHRAQIVKEHGEAQAARITATSDAAVALIKAASEAQALIMRTQTRTELLRLGTDSDKADQAAEMLRLQSIDTDLPEDRRMNDDALAKLLAPPRTRGANKRPGSGPKGVVLPLRQPPDE